MISSSASLTWCKGGWLGVAFTPAFPYRLLLIPPKQCALSLHMVTIQLDMGLIVNKGLAYVSSRSGERSGSVAGFEGRGASSGIDVSDPLCNSTSFVLVREASLLAPSAVSMYDSTEGSFDVHAIFVPIDSNARRVLATSSYVQDEYGAVDHGRSPSPEPRRSGGDKTEKKLVATQDSHPLVAEARSVYKTVHGKSSRRSLSAPARVRL